MGGTIAMTLREPDGTEHRMARWTNIMPWAFSTLGFLEKDPAHLDALLGQWRDMARDWDRNGPDGPFEFNMTPCYAPHRELVPTGYGMVVADMQNDVILHSQGYTSIGKLSVAGVSLEWGSPNPDSTYQGFKTLWQAGRIVGAEYWDGSAVAVDGLDGVSLGQLRTKIQDPHWRRSDGAWMYFVVDMRPFTVESFQEYDQDDQRRMLTRIRELGFHLSEKEEAGWEAWFEHCRQ